jgi:peptidoglycan/LPS O-acetylase OafA/YrhL
MRGIAALFVVLFHVLEIYAGGDHVQQLLNYSYRAISSYYRHFVCGS